jgi:hypothetical protein
MTKLMLMLMLMLIIVIVIVIRGSGSSELGARHDKKAEIRKARCMVWLLAPT